MVSRDYLSNATTSGWRRALALCWLLGALACAGPVSGGTGSAAPPSETPPRTTHDYVMAPERQTQFLRSLLQIRMGDPLLEVTKRLGPPRYDEITRQKGWPPKFLYRILRYYVKRWDPELSNVIHDRVVDLLFDQKDHLAGVRSNVEGYRLTVSMRSAPPGTAISELVKRD